ncbi:hypothetical protein VL04_14170 [Chromobacterium violaceum]|nr:hypothetical protein UF16_01610 [Chromobacterium violaceum]KMN50717.1 hypothetical protein VK93_04875 [Chromobacterium violaceum]KMN87213.1 hypothetical protein VL02_05230 [Chromobacterium violaceum]KMN89662.1 hypothetical protein VL04_14170 [Chromobacterium violaceum]KMO03705.1 hypothetical protein VL16_11925 [Chromobacterium violaceum]
MIFFFLIENDEFDLGMIILFPNDERIEMARRMCLGMKVNVSPISSVELSPIASAIVSSLELLTSPM